VRSRWGEDLLQWGEIWILSLDPLSVKVPMPRGELRVKGRLPEPTCHKAIS